MLNLASRLSDVRTRVGAPPWLGYEHVKGWGVFGIPFDSGHVLALRVFPENDFSPYRMLWHRDPKGRWSIYVDGQHLDTACPRYYGPACTTVGHATIGLEWTGPASLRIRMDAPRLEWTLTAPRADGTAALGLGEIQMSGTMPSGHAGTLMPQRMYFMDETSALVDGVDLGRATRVSPNPLIGQVPLPARCVLAIGQGAWQIPESNGGTA